MFDWKEVNIAFIRGGGGGGADAVIAAIAVVRISD